MATFLYTQMPNTKGNQSKHPPKHEPVSGIGKVVHSKPLPSNKGYMKPFTGK